MTVITYDELAAGLEDAWIMAGLHEHALYENIHPETLDRSYRVELFPEHPEPLNENNSPPWVEMIRTEERPMASFSSIQSPNAEPHAKPPA